MTPEGRVKALVKRTIEKEFPGAYRFMPVQNGMGAPGLDFYYCIRGMFVAIETKAPGKKMTERQGVTRDAIHAADGVAYLVWDEQSMREVLALLHMRLRFWKPEQESRYDQGNRQETRTNPRSTD